MNRRTLGGKVVFSIGKWRHIYKYLTEASNTQIVSEIKIPIIIPIIKQKMKTFAKKSEKLSDEYLESISIYLGIILSVSKTVRGQISPFNIFYLNS